MSEPLRPSLLGLVAAAIAGGTAASYVMIIRSQGDPPLTDSTVVSVFVGISGCAVLAALGALTAEPGRRFNLLIAATVGLFLLGLMGIFSIGFPLLIGGALTLAEVLRLRPRMDKGHLAKAEGRRQEARREARRQGKKFP